MPLTTLPAIQRCRAIATQAEVWAIMRFDQTTASLEVFWSERNVPGAEIADYGGRRAYGSHAEPVLVRCFPQAIIDHGMPNLVEIFLGRSPCFANSPLMNFGGVVYHAGCGNKLITLANQYPGIPQFNIYYDIVYVGNPAHPNLVIQAESIVMINRLNAHPRILAVQTVDLNIVNP